MKNLIIVLISLFTFSSYSSFANSKIEKTILKTSSVENLEYNVSNSSELSQIKINNTFNSPDEKVVFGWICHGKVVNVESSVGTDGNIYYTITIEITCFWYEPPQGMLSNW